MGKAGGEGRRLTGLERQVVVAEGVVERTLYAIGAPPGYRGDETAAEPSPGHIVRTRDDARIAQPFLRYLSRTERQAVERNGIGVLALSGHGKRSSCAVGGVDAYDARNEGCQQVQVVCVDGKVGDLGGAQAQLDRARRRAIGNPDRC